jgi:hypothetical protein
MLPLSTLSPECRRPFAWPHHHMDPGLPQSQECLGIPLNPDSRIGISRRRPIQAREQPPMQVGPCREPAGESERHMQDSDCRWRMETLRTKGNASRAKTTGSRAKRESWAVPQSSHTAGRVGDAEFSWARIVSNEAEFNPSRWRKEGDSQSYE